jgi:hypothetical protein
MALSTIEKAPTWIVYPIRLSSRFGSLGSGGREIGTMLLQAAAARIRDKKNTWCHFHSGFIDCFSIKHLLS